MKTPSVTVQCSCGIWVRVLGEDSMGVLDGGLYGGLRGLFLVFGQGPVVEIKNRERLIYATKRS